MVAASELTINTGISADQMAETLFGASIEIVSASYEGDAASAGIWSGGDRTGVT